MSKKWLLSILPVFVCLLPAKNALSQFDDLEKEFFESAKVLEENYKDFEQKAFENFQHEVKAMWGDFVISTTKDWVEYSDNRTGRSRVDFESGEVLVEILVPEKKADKNPGQIEKKLAGEIENLVSSHGKKHDYKSPGSLSTPQQHESYFEEQADSPFLLSQPVLAGQVADKQGKPVTSKNRNAFASEIIKTKPIVKKKLHAAQGNMIKAGITFSLVPDHLRIRAQGYLDQVRKNAKRFGISVPLAFAVMHTESYFNPKATSYVPAYGLMQLVPNSGALDAYLYVYKVKKILSADYLYSPRNNIELGCAYLGLLKNLYFRDVSRPENSLYCAVASYNTGPGNLSRALCGKKHIPCAIERANDMKPEDLFMHLRTHLPYPETRRYLEKVIHRMNLYKEWE